MMLWSGWVSFDSRILRRWEWRSLLWKATQSSQEVLAQQVNQTLFFGFVPYMALARESVQQPPGKSLDIHWISQRKHEECFWSTWLWWTKYVWHREGTIRRCIPVGGDGVLLVEVCNCGDGLKDTPLTCVKEYLSILFAFGTRCRTFSSSSTMSVWILPCFLPW